MKNILWHWWYKIIDKKEYYHHSPLPWSQVPFQRGLASFLGIGECFLYEARLLPFRFCRLPDLCCNDSTVILAWKQPQITHQRITVWLCSNKTLWTQVRISYNFHVSQNIILLVPPPPNHLEMSKLLLVCGQYKTRRQVTVCWPDVDNVW